jgi:hypothetical protein
VKAEAAGEVLKYAACVTSRPRPAIRESPVAIAKIAVLTAIRRRGGVGGGGVGWAPVVMVSVWATGGL